MNIVLILVSIKAHGLIGQNYIFFDSKGSLLLCKVLTTILIASIYHRMLEK